jgi:hypothetical protein
VPGAECRVPGEPRFRSALSAVLAHIAAGGASRKPYSVDDPQAAPGTRHAVLGTRHSALGTPYAALPVIGLGVAVELLLVIGLVRPLWLFGPRDAITTNEPLATLLGISLRGVLGFATTIALWLAGYALAMALCRRSLTSGARRALYLFPLLFAATLLLVLPVSSKDVYHYLMEGRILAVHGDNPMSVPPAAYPQDRLYWVMSSWEDTPSRYGPVFNLLAGAVAIAGHESFAATVLGFKLLAVAALLGAAALAALTARRVRPELALPVFVLVAWNPLALYEAAANAHNDLLMVFFTALSLYFAVRGRWELAFPALALGVLTKYVVVLLGPVLLLECRVPSTEYRVPRAACRVRRLVLRRVLGFGSGGSFRLPSAVRPFAGGEFYSALRIPRSALFGIGLSLALVVALYLPFWNGARTFDALRSASGDMGASPGWLLRQALKHPLGWEGARPVVVGVMTAVFLAGYAAILIKCLGRSAECRVPGAECRVLGEDDAPAAGSLGAGTVDPPEVTHTAAGHKNPVPGTPSEALGAHQAVFASTAFAVLLLELCTLSWWMWPWYALWLLPAAALLANRRTGLLAIVITGSALAAYIPINFRELFWGPVPTDRMPLAAVLTSFLPPIVVAAVIWSRGRRARHSIDR